MTAPAPSPAEQAVIDRFEAAEVPEEIRVERVALAIMDADYEQATGGLMNWLDLDEAEHDDYRAMARAAIAALDPS